VKAKSLISQSLISGLIAVTLTGCQAGASAAEGAASSGTSPGTETATKPHPVRVSRAFFIDQKLSGQITVKTPSGEDIHVKTPIEWFEEPTSQKPPRAGALADFRDHPGCAHYQGADTVAVCFNMMGDVYSLGVNGKDVTLRGVESYLTDAISRSTQSGECSYTVKNIQFIKASKSDHEVSIHYQGDLVPDSKCTQSPTQLAVQFQFQSV
jgi:hypothetical protein